MDSTNERASKPKSSTRTFPARLYMRTSCRLALQTRSEESTEPHGGEVDAGGGMGRERPGKETDPLLDVRGDDTERSDC